MIDISNQQRKNIWKPTIPDTWDGIVYKVYSNSQSIAPLFQGKAINNDDFEIDVTDWIEQEWNRTGDATFVLPSPLYVVVENSADSSENIGEVFSMDKNASTIPPYTATDETYMTLTFKNSDFKDNNGGYDISIPLQVCNGILRGKTINNITKTTYMDRYNDIHNSTATNKIELECYVDSDWLHTLTGSDRKYTEIMMVAQTARGTHLNGNAQISGFNMVTDISNLNCRVKDIQKIETYSRYNQSHPIPSLKITIEIYK